LDRDYARGEGFANASCNTIWNYLFWFDSAILVHFRACCFFVWPGENLNSFAHLFCVGRQGCPRGAFECYFQPTSSCSRRDDTPRYAWVTDAIEINPPIYSNASPLAWGEEDRCKDSENCVDFDEIPSPAVLLDAGSELEGRQVNKSVNPFFFMAVSPKHTQTLL
jgi:hypothetical protein